jgi:ribosomal protein S27AE
MSTSQAHDVKHCPRCGGTAIYWPEAIVPGDPMAPRGSRRSAAHHQPAWVCLSCGHLQSEERRGTRIAERQPT